MSEPIMERRFAGHMERHIQTIIVTLTLGAIMFAGNWIFTKTREDASGAAATNAQIQILTSQVVELRADVRAFSGAFVRRDEFNDHENRIRRLEEKVGELRARAGLPRESLPERR